MKEAVIVSTARTPIGKAYKGAFNNTHGATLAGHAVKKALEKAKLNPELVEDCLMGCAMPEGATGGNIARQIALRGGLPVTTAGATINRFCSSGMQAITMAAQRIITNELDVCIAGGLESISLVQNEHQNRKQIFNKASQIVSDNDIMSLKQELMTKIRNTSGYFVGHFLAF